MANEMVDVYNPGTDLSCRASADVVGKRFVKITGDRSAGNIAVAHATAGTTARAFGVSKYDAASGQIVGVARGNARVVTVTADGNIAAGAGVEIGTAGKAKTTGGTNPLVGVCVTGVSDGGDAQVSLY